jgi:hypothetical protein
MMWATLEWCGRTPKGYAVDPSHVIVALLIENGLLTVRSSGLVGLTVKGRTVLKRRAMRPPKRKRKTGQEQPMPKVEELDRPSAVTRSPFEKKHGFTLLPFSRRQSRQT